MHFAVMAPQEPSPSCTAAQQRGTDVGYVVWISSIVNATSSLLRTAPAKPISSSRIHSCLYPRPRILSRLVLLPHLLDVARWRCAKHACVLAAELRSTLVANPVGCA